MIYWPGQVRKHYFPVTWRGRASCEAIEGALERMKTIASEEGLVSIAMPQIGSGYGGLSWKKVRGIVFENRRGMLIYEEYVPGE